MFLEMSRHGSRSFSPAVHDRLPRRPPRITIQVIRLAAKTAMSQARTFCNIFLVMQVRKLSYYILVSKADVVIRLPERQR
ncbi:MAG: hypothetical protein J7J70_09565 [Deltaproteobacteria bacterium]|nr:hypothetical protein [Candidatus Tharpellaceae bacterium]